MIRYKELSWPLKAAVIGGWVVLAEWAIAILIGFVIGFTGG